MSDADRERRMRPEPASSFKSELRERLRDDAREPAWRPRRPAALALAYVGSGTALLALAALGLAGVGPLS